MNAMKTHWGHRFQSGVATGLLALVFVDVEGRPRMEKNAGRKSPVRTAPSTGATALSNPHPTPAGMGTVEDGPSATAAFQKGCKT